MERCWLVPYDLEPPSALPPLPHATPLRTAYGQNPLYEPGPLADGMARVVLHSAGYEEPAEFAPYSRDRHLLTEPYRVFDVPAEQYERWLATRAAFDAMQEEIEATISARARESHG